MHDFTLEDRITFLPRQSSCRDFLFLVVICVLSGFYNLAALECCYFQGGAENAQLAFSSSFGNLILTMFEVVRLL